MAIDFDSGLGLIFSSLQIFPEVHIIIITFSVKSLVIY